MVLPNQGKGSCTGSGDPAVRVASPYRDDERLVAAILAGSRAHFDRLYDACFPRVHSYALHRLGAQAPAEAVTRNVLFAVFRELPHWPGRTSLLAWVFALAREAIEAPRNAPRSRATRTGRWVVRESCRHDA